VIQVDAEALDGTFHLAVRDDGDGDGDADPGKGSGLVGLQDRVEAIGGRIAITSPPGGGTALLVTIALADGWRGRRLRVRGMSEHGSAPMLVTRAVDRWST
jgi:glucose-6-phosphate-specific signal transduction histidine kinase